VIFYTLKPAIRWAFFVIYLLFTTFQGKTSIKTPFFFIFFGFEKSIFIFLGIDIIKLITKPVIKQFSYGLQIYL